MGCVSSTASSPTTTRATTTTEKVVAGLETPETIQTLSRVSPTISGSLGPLSLLPSLTDCELSNCRLLQGVLDPLNACRGLRRLVLHRCQQLSGSLDTLLELDPLDAQLNPSPALSLLILDISYCSGLRGSLEALAPCLQLRFLDCSGCTLLESSLEPLRPLRQLRCLKLNNLPLLGGSLEPLRRHAALYCFQCAGCVRLGRGSWQGSLEPLLSSVLPRMTTAASPASFANYRRKPTNYRRHARLNLRGTALRVPPCVFAGRRTCVCSSCLNLFGMIDAAFLFQSRVTD